MSDVQFESWDLPILYPLVAIYKLLVLVNFPHPLTFAIVGLTILVRLVLFPLFSAQIKSSTKMQKLTPEISRVKEKYKGDNKMIQQETMKLYKEHGVNPVAGCLPVLFQLPLIFILYSVLIDAVKDPLLVTTRINEVIKVDLLKLTTPIDQSFFFFPLGQTPAQLLSSIGPLIFLIPVLTGLFQLVQSKMMFPKRDDSLPKAKDDFASIFQSQATYIFPVMIGAFSFTFPVGLSLYWNTFTIFGIIQQYLISGLGGLEPWIQKIKTYGRK